MSKWSTENDLHKFTSHFDWWIPHESEKKKKLLKQNLNFLFLKQIIVDNKK